MDYRGLLGLDPRVSGREQPSFYRDVEGEFDDIQQGLLGMLPMAGMATAPNKIKGLLSTVKKARPVPKWKAKYPDRGGGIYEAKLGNKVARIEQNEERTGYGLGKEWKLLLDDEWHETYRTMKEAKQGLLDYMARPVTNY